MRWSQRMVCGLMVLAVTLLFAATSSATTNWTGIGDWTDDASNWSGGLPHASNSGNIRWGTVAIDTDAAGVLNLYFSNGVGLAGDSTLNMSGGTLTGSDLVAFYGRDNSTQIWNMGGGTGTFPGYMSLMNNFNPDSANASATLNMTGGSLSFGGDIIFGSNERPAALTRTAHIQLDGGILSAAAITTALGGGTPTMDIAYGGTLILDGNVSSLPSFVTAAGFADNLLFNYSAAANKTTITAIPEPSTCVLLGIGVLCLGLVARRRRE